MTYSIVACDAHTGQFGVGVQTHQPTVGAVVPWAKPGVGAVATQSLTNKSFGPLGLELLEGRLSAEKALAALLASDPGADQRQVALVDRKGDVAVHTGARCIPFAGHRTGAGYSVQANMMLKDTVPAAMAAAFEGSEGPLVVRIMAALEAAEAEGGDIRGAQSAAILVVGAEDKPDWDNVVANLRVDEHPNPIAELRRLVTFSRANALSREGDTLAEAGELEKAIETWAQARALAPDTTEMTFWQALTLADNHARLEEAKALLDGLYAQEPHWRELLPRLVPAGLLDHPEIVPKLV